MKDAHFLVWLFAQQHQVGKLLDTKNLPNISHLLSYISKSILINKTVFKIHAIEPVIGRVRVKLEDEYGQVLGGLTVSLGVRLKLLFITLPHRYPSPILL